MLLIKWCHSERETVIRINCLYIIYYIYDIYIHATHIYCHGLSKNSTGPKMEDRRVFWGGGGGNFSGIPKIRNKGRIK